ncbi:transport and Golgi organization protein 6 homolog [Colletes gigas]|uniref:transport and Golgi organization protein 6 homolog n=1 Tax=Colletes gigas TaxID=935657 RepID=UPI001C9BA8DF|nr:transport and Golgi organization protein 6 homolog [Colletes gigas]
MDSNEILYCLTTVNKTDDEEIENFDSRLQCVVQKILPLLTEYDKQFILDDTKDENDSLDIRYQYLRAIVCILQSMKASEITNDESIFSVKQFHVLKVAIELLIAVGIIPGLLPGVGNDMSKLCPRALQICEEKVSDLQKYKRLKFAVNSLMGLNNEITFRSAIFTQLGPLLASLLQLCHAPLMKPCKEFESIKRTDTSRTEFKMTTDLYDKLKRDQELFTPLLHQLLNSCPMSMAMKELMVILGIKGAPKWLQKETRKYLIQQIMQPNGIVSLVTVVCDDILDFGEHWNKLDTVSRLIATSHGNNPKEYYQAICLQILDLLTSKSIKHSSTIANYCIIALHEYNPEICIKNIMEVICEPLLAELKNKQDVIKSESEVEKCIEILMKCFVTVDVQFKQLPCKLLMKVAVPLFCLYNNVRQSACSLKSKLKQLILKLLHEESSRSDLFAELLGHSLTGNFGRHLVSRFGPTGGIEIIGTDTILKYEEFADSLRDLTSTTNVLSTELFSYLLTYLSSLIKSGLEKEAQNLLETEDDIMERIEKHLTAVKLLSNLADIPAIQEAQIKNPESILSFIKLLYKQYIKNRQNPSEEGISEVLYVSIMLIEMIVNVKEKPVNWPAFDDFAKFLKECCTLSDIPKQLLLLMQKLIEIIETQGQLKQKCYQDLSVDSKASNMFDDALRDIADPLLPIRAHGLITLTKMIENMDPCATARKSIILQLFKENLKHEDSFIYLAAINGLCALATSYPQVIIETLVKEYISMADRVSSGEITVETRLKLGEILVKVTRTLGEMAPAYKNVLINGFLCATRDTDSLIRASSLSCLGELCKVLGFRLGDILIEVIYCISCIIKTDKVPECRRAAVMVATLLLRGLGRDTLTSLGKDLVELYRGLKHLWKNDEDPVLRLHAQLALEELDDIVRDFLFSPSKLEKRIFLLNES